MLALTCNRLCLPFRIQIPSAHSPHFHTSRLPETVGLGAPPVQLTTERICCACRARIRSGEIAVGRRSSRSCSSLPSELMSSTRTSSHVTIICLLSALSETCVMRCISSPGDGSYNLSRLKMFVLKLIGLIWP